MSFVLLAALLLGFVAGLRTFTAPAILLLMRRGGTIAIILGVLALAEFAGDLLPNTPARTGVLPLIARIISGGFVGWWIATSAGASAPAGAALGIAGVLVGAYGGIALRLKAIRAIGAVPSALLEDVVAIVIAVAVVART